MSDDKAKPLQSMIWENDKLWVLDQLLLPEVTKYVEVNGVEDAWHLINKMQVRGAPAIAIVGCLSLASELVRKEFTDKESLLQEIETKLNYLVTARPTAVNMKAAAKEFVRLANELCGLKTVDLQEMKEAMLRVLVEMLEDDITINKQIGDNGAKEILQNNPDDAPINILTHCNTGTLATAGYGTALGVIRSLHEKNRLGHVYCTETRPYNQGARLTAYELVHDRLPATLICDDMVAALMKSKKIHAVVVGADRIAANGDTANKIGTYQNAIVANYHNVPFYVAAAESSVDFDIPSGDEIVIEERPEHEMTHVMGQRIAAPGVKCWNPSFDVTPASLITKMIMYHTVYEPHALANIKS